MHSRSFNVSAVTLYGMLWVLASNGIANGEDLSLDQAKRIAVERNAAIKASEFGVDALRAREIRAAAGFYPAIDIKFGSEQAASGGGDKASTFGFLEARWNLYRGGRDIAGKRAVNIETRLAELELDQRRFAIENQVEEVFSNLLFLRDLAKIKADFIELNSKQQSLAKQIVANGGGSASDVVEFDLRASTLRSELTQIEQNYKGYLVRFKSLLGEDIAKNPTPNGALSHHHVQGSLADYANPNLIDSPQVESSALALDLAGVRSGATRGRWLPELDLEGRVGSLPGSEGGESGKVDSSVAVVASWEIFSGFDARSESREMLALKSKADWQLRSDINALLADIESRFGELVNIQIRSDLEKNNIKTAKKYYDLIFSDFKRGYKNSADFSSAAQSWYEAEVQRKRLDLEFVEKKLQLELRLGRRVNTVAMKDLEEGAQPEEKEVK